MSAVYAKVPHIWGGEQHKLSMASDGCCERGSAVAADKEIRRFGRSYAAQDLPCFGCKVGSSFPFCAGLSGVPPSFVDLGVRNQVVPRPNALQMVHAGRLPGISLMAPLAPQGPAQIADLAVCD